MFHRPPQPYQQAHASSSTNPLPTPEESQPSPRQLAQRARRQRERSLQQSSNNPPTPPATQMISRQQASQRARRERERAPRAAAPQSTPEPGNGQEMELPPTPGEVNRRQMAQRIRRERERAARTSIANTASGSAPLTPVHSQASNTQAQPPTDATINLMHQPPLHPPNPLTPPATQQVRHSRKCIEYHNLSLILIIDL